MGAEDQSRGLHVLRLKTRLLSLDAFRGLTVFLMLLVNNVALDTFTPAHLMHAPWNGGVRLADLVFPWFLFCVGVAIPFSASSFRKSGLPAWRFDLRVLWRTALLVLLGCLLSSLRDGRLYFSLDVLQLIGLAYMVAALLYDLPIHRRILIAVGFLAAYGLALRYVPFADSPAGTFEENANLVRHINTVFLSPFNLNGLPSVIPTSALVLLGSAIGDAVLAFRETPKRLLALLVGAGASMTLAGWLWNEVLSYNKPVWTPSYILLSGGLACLVLAVMYAVIDVRGWRAWAYPFLVFGSNAIVAYVLPIVIKLGVLSRVNIGAKPFLPTVLDACVSAFGRVGGGWAYTLGYILVWWLVLWVLYWRKWFLRV